MRVLLAGGGSGGHVTPLKAVYDALQKKDTQLEVTIVTDRGFLARTTEIFADDTVVIQTVFSGKLRRYHSKSLLWHVLHLPTLVLNVRDVFLLGVGIVQAMCRFLVKRPDVVFCKGGFTCVPIGIAARFYNIPIIIHDSDTRPGITNRFLSRYAAIIATGMPTSFYPYAKQKMHYTGIPVKAAFQPVSKTKQADYKATLMVDAKRPLLLVTGGGNGSLPLNTQLAAAAQQLLQDGWSIMLLAGQGKTAVAEKARAALSPELQKHWVIEAFADMTPRLLAADLVIARTSASTIQECANAQKAVIGVPSPHLMDQKQNAAFFAAEGAIMSLDETALSDDGSDIVHAVGECREVGAGLAARLHKKFAKPSAADTLAELIMSTQLHQKT